MKMPRGLDFALCNANFTIKLILKDWNLLDSDVVSSRTRVSIVTLGY